MKVIAILVFLLSIGFIHMSIWNFKMNALGGKKNKAAPPKRFILGQRKVCSKF